MSIVLHKPGFMWLNFCGERACTFQHLYYSFVVFHWLCHLLSAKIIKIKTLRLVMSSELKSIGYALHGWSTKWFYTDNGIYLYKSNRKSCLSWIWHYIDLLGVLKGWLCLITTISLHTLSPVHNSCILHMVWLQNPNPVKILWWYFKFLALMSFYGCMDHK